MSTKRHRHIFYFKYIFRVLETSKRVIPLQTHHQICFYDHNTFSTDSTVCLFLLYDLEWMQLCTLLCDPQMTSFQVTSAVMNVFIMSTYRVFSATAGRKKRTHNGTIILLDDLVSGLCTSQLELRILVFVQRLRLLQERPVNLAGTILPLTTLTFTRSSLPTLRHICSQKISLCDFINLM